MNREKVSKAIRENIIDDLNKNKVGKFKFRDNYSCGFCINNKDWEISSDDFVNLYFPRIIEMKTKIIDNYNKFGLKQKLERDISFKSDVHLSCLADLCEYSTRKVIPISSNYLEYKFLRHNMKPIVVNWLDPEEFYLIFEDQLDKSELSEEDLLPDVTFEEKDDELFLVASFNKN